MNTCDIIIPTYNGAEKLEQHVIPALREQAIPAGWKVKINVCDDGSEKIYTDKYAWNDPWQSPSIRPLAHGGRSKTRNAGIESSSADILIFLADDIILRKGALAEHLIFHKNNPAPHHGALGNIAWDPRITPTAFMEWMMHGGQQNDYDSILGAHMCDPAHFFYGSFLSIKRSFLEATRFSEEFIEYGWEDLELGCRLANKGLSLTYLQNSLALHRHTYSANAILERQYLVGLGVKNVNMSPRRIVIHRLYQVSGLRAVITAYIRAYGDAINLPWLFEIATAGEFWRGVYNQDVHRRG